MDGQSERAKGNSNAPFLYASAWLMAAHLAPSRPVVGNGSRHSGNNRHNCSLSLDIDATNFQFPHVMLPYSLLSGKS